MPRARRFDRFSSDGPDHHFREPTPAVAAYQRGFRAWLAGADRAAREHEATTELVVAWERGYDRAAVLLPEAASSPKA